MPVTDGHGPGWQFEEGGTSVPQQTRSLAQSAALTHATPPPLLLSLDDVPDEELDPLLPPLDELPPAPPEPLLLPELPDPEGHGPCPDMQKLSSWSTQHLFTLRSQGVVPHRGTPLSVDAWPSALPSSPLDVAPEDEDTLPLLTLPLDDDVDEEEGLDPPPPVPSGVPPPVEASELATPLVLPPQPGAPRAAQRMTAAVMASAVGLTTFTRGPRVP
jgi:hypothetical protein